MCVKAKEKVKDLLISIVSYGTNIQVLDRVISSIGLDSLMISSDLLIVDNLGSADLKLYCSENDYKYVYPGANLGFGCGHNLAATFFESTYKVHLILNPDVFISPQTIMVAFNYLQENTAVSLVSPRLLNEDGSIQNICRFLPSVFRLMTRVVSKFISIEVARLEDQFNLSETPISVPAIHGACFFVRACSFVQVNGFDDRYFLYVEDIDLCRELGEMGSIVYLPTCTAVHTHAKGSYKNMRLFRYHLRSFVTYFMKWGLFSDSKGRFINKTAIKANF
jgi:hypothetical protein